MWVCSMYSATPCPRAFARLFAQMACGIIASRLANKRGLLFGTSSFVACYPRALLLVAVLSIAYCGHQSESFGRVTFATEWHAVVLGAGRVLSTWKGSFWLQAWGLLVCMESAVCS